MNTAAKLILRVAKKLDADEKSGLIREILKLRAEDINAPCIPADNFDPSNNIKHAQMYEHLLEIVRDACETTVVYGEHCHVGCERYEESLEHGGCVECIHDVATRPTGLRITPGLWHRYKPHVEYAGMVLGLTLTEDEALDAYC